MFCSSRPWASVENTFVADKTSEPELTVTRPVSLLTALTVNVPVPARSSPPEPVIADEMVLLPVIVT